MQPTARAVQPVPESRENQVRNQSARSCKSLTTDAYPCTLTVERLGRHSRRPAADGGSLERRIEAAHLPWSCAENRLLIREFRVRSPGGPSVDLCVCINYAMERSCIETTFAHILVSNLLARGAGSHWSDDCCSRRMRPTRLRLQGELTTQQAVAVGAEAPRWTRLPADFDPLSFWASYRRMQPRDLEAPAHRRDSGTARCGDVGRLPPGEAAGLVWGVLSGDARTPSGADCF